MSKEQLKIEPIKVEDGAKPGNVDQVAAPTQSQASLEEEVMKLRAMLEKLQAAPAVSVSGGVAPPPPNRKAWEKDRGEVRVSKLPNGTVVYDF